MRYAVRPTSQKFSKRAKERYILVEHRPGPPKGIGGVRREKIRFSFSRDRKRKNKKKGLLKKKGGGG